MPHALPHHAARWVSAPWAMGSSSHPPYAEKSWSLGGYCCIGWLPPPAAAAAAVEARVLHNHNLSATFIMLAASLPHRPWGPPIQPTVKERLHLEVQAGSGRLPEWLAPPPAAAAAHPHPHIASHAASWRHATGVSPEPSLLERQHLGMQSGLHNAWHHRRCRRRCRHRRCCRRHCPRCCRARSAHLPSIQWASCFSWQPLTHPLSRPVTLTICRQDSTGFPGAGATSAGAHPMGCGISAAPAPP